MLNDKILDKYNILFTEVAEYYSLEEHIIRFPSTDTCIILSTDLGCGTDKLTATPKEVVYAHLRKNYPSLLPFYKLFFTIRNTKVDLSACEKYFNQINVVIKKIRSETLPNRLESERELEVESLKLQLELLKKEAEVVRKHAEVRAEYAQAKYTQSKQEEEKEKRNILDKLMGPYGPGD